MAKSKSTRTRSARPSAGNKGDSVPPPPESSEAFGKLHYRLLLHTQQLRLVSNALNEPSSAAAVDAASFVVPTIVRQLDELHSEFDRWEMSCKQDQQS